MIGGTSFSIARNGDIEPEDIHEALVGGRRNLDVATARRGGRCLW